MRTNDMSSLDALKQILVRLIEQTYPNHEKIKEYKSFIIKASPKESKSRHGEYRYSNHCITIFNIDERSNASLVVTTIHELAHHIDFCNRERSDHQKPFYAEYKKLLFKALDTNLFSKEEFFESIRDASDTNKVKKMIAEYEKNQENPALTEEESKLLTANGYYLVFSQLSRRPYLDKVFRCYIFETVDDAMQFCEKVKDTFIDAKHPARITQTSFFTLCYSLGISALRIKLLNSESYLDIKIERKFADSQYYNPIANRNIIRLKQTNKKKYLKELVSADFFSPATMESRTEGNYPSIHYSYATLTSNNTYYLLFTTLQELEQWSKSQNTSYYSIQTTLGEYSGIRDRHPVLINPLSDRLVITNEQLLELDI